jgi:hypothetical protein
MRARPIFRAVAVQAAGFLATCLMPLIMPSLVPQSRVLQAIDSSDICYANPLSTKSVSPTVQRGHALRKEIDATYAKMKARGGERSSLDMTALVTKYIPLGSSFEDAAEVLRNAGCKVTARNFDNHTPYLHPSDSTFASITLSTGLFSATTFSVELSPEAPGGSAIETIRAAIATEYP